MARQIRYSLLGLVVFLITSAITIQPENVEAQFRLIVDNQTSSTTTLILSGPEYYSFPLTTNKNRIDVEEGTYQYSYYACNQYNQGELKVKKDKTRFIIRPCDGEAEASELTINNRTGEAFRITITGDKTYFFFLDNGKNTVNLPPGKYQYTYFACGVQSNGSINVKKKNDDLKLECSSSATVKVERFTIFNRTGGPLYITLVGPEVYNLTILGPNQRVEIVRGEYDYTVTACGQTETGTVKIKSIRKWFWSCKNN